MSNNKHQISISVRNSNDMLLIARKKITKSLRISEQQLTVGSKENTLGMLSGHCSPHLQVPSVVRY